jgi:hypothetical protein
MRTIYSIALVSFLVCLNAMPAEARRKKAVPKPAPVEDTRNWDKRNPLNYEVMEAYAARMVPPYPFKKLHNVYAEPVEAVPIIPVTRALPLVVATTPPISTKLGIGLLIATLSACIVWVLSTTKRESNERSSFAVTAQRQQFQRYSTPVIKNPRRASEDGGKGHEDNDGGRVEQPSVHQSPPDWLGRKVTSRGHRFHPRALAVDRPHYEPLDLYRLQLRSDPDTA